MKPKSDLWTGTLAVLGAYVLWGFLPLYWKLMKALPAEVLLGHRIVWALVFTVGLLVVLRRIGDVWAILKHGHNALLIALAALLISINWGVYILAVNANQIVETALGYYINPLVSVVLALIFLKERLSLWQVVALAAALAGVLIMAVSYGHIPWIALSLALSFGFYGLIKKVVHAPAAVSLTLETLFALPLAVFFLWQNPTVSNPTLLGAWGWWLVILSGPVTALPLLLFGIGARRIPMAFNGFLQYLSPSISLCLGVFLFHEPFAGAEIGAFGLIWAGLVVFTWSQWRRR